LLGRVLACSDNWRVGVLGNLAGILLSAKASAVSGALILAGGAVISASTGAGMTGLMRNDPEVTPIVNVVEPEESDDDEFDFQPASEEPEDDESDTEEIVPVGEPDCEGEETARAEARGRIDVAFKKYDAALDKLRAELNGKGSAAVYESLENADALLAEIHTQALGALEEMGLCLPDLAAGAQGAVAFNLSVGALALFEVSDRAIAAMETVYNLARSTVLQELERLKPTPTPKPKKTDRPKATEKPKQTRAPHCDDAMYAAKKRLQKAFDEYHGGHDKLMKELKGWASESSMRAFWSADSVLHKTYDKTRERIINAGCATGEHSSMALAESAEIVLRETYQTSKELHGMLAVNKPDHEACEDAMYAAKERLYEAYEIWHTANDKLWSGVKSFGNEAAIDAAKGADQIIHETYDRTKQSIYNAHCTPTGSNAMQLAENAADVFEQAHHAARVAVAAELAKKD
jgi:hypothetical protein